MYRSHLLSRSLSSRLRLRPRSLLAPSLPLSSPLATATATASSLHSHLYSIAPSRSFSLSSFFTRLLTVSPGSSATKDSADSNPGDANDQATLLNEWLKEGKFREIVERVQSNQYAHNGETQRIYLQAINQLQKLGIMNVHSSNTTNHYNSNIGMGMKTSSNMMASARTNSSSSSSTGSVFPSNVPVTRIHLHHSGLPENTKIPDPFNAAYYPQNTTNPMTSPNPYLYPFSSAPSATSDPLGSSRNPIFIADKAPSWAQLILRLLPGVIGFYIILKLISPDKDGSGGLGGLSPFSSQRAYKEYVDNGEVPPVSFKDIKGCDEAKAELEDIVEFLKNPAKFQRLGGKMPRGVLLHGDPGVGKTLLARAVAGEAGVPFFATSGSEFEEVFVGLGAKKVRELFKKARGKAPCIVFIDEIDAIGAKRSPKDPAASRLSLNQLLSELDGFENESGVIVIAATNLAKALDPALTRPGRFDRQVTVPLPDVKGRLEILQLYGSKVPLAPEVDLKTIARRTPGLSGADLFNLINEAAIRASLTNQQSIGQKELDYAQDKIAMGPERNIKYSEQSRRLTAFHEGGHTLVSLFTPQAMPLYKVTIIPRSNALGVTSFVPEEEPGITRAQLMARMDVLMGGRVAEHLTFGADNVTAGASDDLRKATETARLMVTRLGMGKSAGLQAIDLSEGDQVSPAMMDAIDREVKELLDQSYRRAQEILTRHSDKLHRIATELLEKETLEAEEVRKIIR